jgi:TolB-like protein
MTRAIAAAALALLAARAAAEDAPGAARRAAASLLAQLEARPPRLPVKVLAVAPFKDVGAPTGAGAGRAFGDALAAELGRAGRVQVRDWGLIDAAARDQALRAAFGGTGPLPAVPSVQALVVGEAVAPADGGPVRVGVRLVLVPSGAVAATESVRLDPPARAALAPATVTAPAAGPSPERLLAEAHSVDVAMRRIADALAAGFQKLPGNARYRRLAVLRFGEVGPEARRRELGAVVTAELSTNLRRDHALLLVEREKLGSVLGEVKLGEMGLVDAKSAPRLGQLADAQALVVGSVADGGGKFLVNARIVSTDGAETLAVAQETIPAATLVAFSADAVVLRSRRDAVFRSMLLPGSGQLYNRQPVKAAVFGIAEVGLLGGALAAHLSGAAAEDEYRSKTGGDLGADPSATVAALRRTAEDRYQLRNALLWAAAGVWALNVADAYWSGVDGEAIVAAPLPLAGGGGLALAGRF